VSENIAKSCKEGDFFFDSHCRPQSFLGQSLQEFMEMYKTICCL